MSNDSYIFSQSFYRYAHKQGLTISVFFYKQFFNKQVIDLVKNKIEQGYSYVAIIRVKYGKIEYYIVASSFSFKYDYWGNSINSDRLYTDIEKKSRKFFSFNSVMTGYVCK